MILYEYPFQESMRTMLRLEQLFDRLGQLMLRDTPVDHHFALVTLFEIMDVASRADLKSDLLKELERHKQQLQSPARQPADVRGSARRRDRDASSRRSMRSISCPAKPAMLSPATNG